MKKVFVLFITMLCFVSCDLNTNKIIFLRSNGNQDIYLYDSFSGDLSQLTDTPGNEINPVWSPNGKKFAYFYSHGDESYLYIMTDRGKLKLGLFGLDINFNSISWSPDGSRIAFIQNTESTSSITTLTVKNANTTRRTNNDFLELDVTWSPTENKILFSRDQEENFDLFILDLETYQETQLTFNEGNDMQAVWSPSGLQIAFVSFSNDSEMPVGRIFIYDLMNNTQKQAFDFSGDCRHPLWSPSGDMLSFINYQSDGNQLFAFDYVSNDLIQLTDGSINVLSHSWIQDDSQTIVFSGFSNNSEELFILDLNELNIEQITKDGYRNSSPMASP